MNLLDRLVRVGWRAHRWVYARTGGRIGGRVVNMPVLLLTTIGRRSGRVQATALTYLMDGPNYVVIASSGGAPRHPDWYLNLQAHPEASIQPGKQIVTVRSRVASGSERDRLWARAVAAYRGYARYEKRTTRKIPVVVLEPDVQPQEEARTQRSASGGCDG